MKIITVQTSDDDDKEVNEHMKGDRSYNITLLNLWDSSWDDKYKAIHYVLQIGK